MTEVLYNPKIKPEHLARKAIVYLRQSSEKQVRQNKESQLLQYAVAERVRALGWKQVEIINSDLGSSAGLASARLTTQAYSPIDFRLRRLTPHLRSRLVLSQTKIDDLPQQIIVGPGQEFDFGNKLRLHPVDTA